MRELVRILLLAPEDPLHPGMADDSSLVVRMGAVQHDTMAPNAESYAIGAGTVVKSSLMGVFEGDGVTIALPDRRTKVLRSN